MVDLDAEEFMSIDDDDASFEDAEGGDVPCQH